MNGKLEEESSLLETQKPDLKLKEQGIKDLVEFRTKDPELLQVQLNLIKDLIMAEDLIKAHQAHKKLTMLQEATDRVEVTDKNKVANQ